MTKIPFRQIVASSGVQFGTSGARGLVARMTDEVCHAYIESFLDVVVADAKQVVIGHDLRPSSPHIAAVCAQAVRDSGREPVFVGALPTPAVAYYASRLELPAVIVTGSHIPFDRNGIKFYRADGEITKADETAMLEAMVGQHPVPAVRDGLVAEPAAHSAYVSRYVDFFGAGRLQGMKVAIYEHSSVARDVLRVILEALGVQVRSLGRVDGFVPIDTEAVRPEDVVQARAWADEFEFDAIVSTDGDADRPLIGDERGNWLRGDLVGILCAQFLDAAVVVTPVSSNTAVEACGDFSQVIRTRIGSPYVIAGMQSAVPANDRVVAGFEANGGFLLGSDRVQDGRQLAALPTRDAVLPILALLCSMHDKGCKLSDLAAALPRRFTASDRIQDVPTESSRKLIERMTADAGFAGSLLAPDAAGVQSVDTTDGLRVTFEDGNIVHLRPSGNAPELRCYAEADSEMRAQALCANALKHAANAVAAF